MEPAPLQILVDADACPVKDEVYKVALRHGVSVVVVANMALRVPVHPLISRMVVSDGFDAADDWIAERAGMPHRLVQMHAARRPPQRDGLGPRRAEQQAEAQMLVHHQPHERGQARRPHGRIGDQVADRRIVEERRRQRRHCRIAVLRSKPDDAAVHGLSLADRRGR